MAIRNGRPDRVLGPDYAFEGKVAALKGGNVHYVEQGTAGWRKPTFLLLPGAPAWSYLYRRVIPPLSRVGRVVAPDPLGQGRSDHPVEPEAYTLDARARRVRDLCEELGLERVILVLQGTSVADGLAFAVRNPKLVDGIVVANGWVPGCRMPVGGKVSRAMGRTGVATLVARALAPSLQPVLETGSLDTVATFAYRHPYPNKASRLGLKHLADTGRHPGDAQVLEEIGASLLKLEPPVQVVWGEEDTRLGTAMAAEAANRFRHGRPPVLVPRAGHWLPEQAPDRMSAEVVAFAGSI